MSSCIVHLDNLQGEYRPRNSIIGRVACSFSEPKKLRGIRVELIGQEYTEWQKKVTCNNKDDRKTECRRCFGRNQFLKTVTTVTGDATYPPGRHEYPFRFNLPNVLPASYQGKYGYIKYIIKGYADVPFGFDITDEKEFKVVSPIDFNMMPHLDFDPVVYTAESNLSWFFKSLGTVYLKVQLNKCAFVQGESVILDVDVTNMSSVNVSRLEVRMILAIIEYVTTPVRDEKGYVEKLAEVSDTGVGAHGERSYTFNFVLPNSIVVPNFTTCELFKCSPQLFVTAIVQGFHGDIQVCTDFTLGHIPLQQHQDESSPCEDFPSTHSPPQSQLYREPPPRYEDIPQSSNSAVIRAHSNTDGHSSASRQSSLPTYRQSLVSEAVPESKLSLKSLKITPTAPPEYKSSSSSSPTTEEATTGDMVSSPEEEDYANFKTEEEEHDFVVI